MAFPYPLPELNCLPGGITLKEFVRAERLESFEVLYYRDEAKGQADEGTSFSRCTPSEADIASVNGLSDTFEHYPIHDVELTEAGALEIAAITAALFILINENRVLS